MCIGRFFQGYELVLWGPWVVFKSQFCDQLTSRSGDSALVGSCRVRNSLKASEVPGYGTRYLYDGSKKGTRFHAPFQARF